MNRIKYLKTIYAASKAVSQPISCGIDSGVLGLYRQQKENTAMGLLEFALIFTVVFTLYNLQQIKITLKEKGLTVEVFKGSFKDYRKFKNLIRNESNQILKMKYQKILNSLHFSLFGIVLFAFMLLRLKL